MSCLSVLTFSRHGHYPDGSSPEPQEGSVPKMSQVAKVKDTSPETTGGSVPKMSEVAKHRDTSPETKGKDKRALIK